MHDHTVALSHKRDLSELKLVPHSFSNVMGHESYDEHKHAYIMGVISMCNFEQLLEGLFADMTIVKHDLERDNVHLHEQIRELKNQNKLLVSIVEDERQQKRRALRDRQVSPEVTYSGLLYLNMFVCAILTICNLTTCAPK